MSLESITRPSWSLALETARSPAALACILAALVLDLLARSILPLAIAASNTRGVEIGLELRHLLLGGLTVLALLRYRRWGAALRGQGPFDALPILLLSGSYLHLFGWIALAMPELLIGLRVPALDGGFLWLSIWLSSLAGILSLSRIQLPALTWLFVALAWWVPVVAHSGFPGAPDSFSGISHAAWSAEQILPMLVPQLLGLGFVCLERSHR